MSVGEIFKVCQQFVEGKQNETGGAVEVFHNVDLGDTW